MILGIGSDIIDILRIDSLLKKFPLKFKNRIFTELEQKKADKSYYPTAIYAKRFAAKEAFMKALGLGLSKEILWVDIEVKNLNSGQPTLSIKNKTLKQLNNMVPHGYFPRIDLSLSDTPTIAQAFVVISCEKINARIDIK